jgi:hypothetical protein
MFHPGLEIFWPGATIRVTATPLPSDSAGPPQGSSFPTTRWTLVQKIQRGSPDDARKAMEAICRSYWYPVYSFLRRSGHSQHDAEDLTQMFFQRLIEERSMAAARVHGDALVPEKAAAALAAMAKSIAKIQSSVKAAN